MPSPVRADGSFFACAKSKVKSTHKGVSPLCIPRKGARLWLGGRDTHVTARPDLFFVQTDHAHSPRAVPQNPSAQCPIGPGFPACRGSSHKRGALPPLLWGAPSGCRGISRASRLREKAASGGVLVWNPKRRAPLRKAPCAYPFGLAPNGCCRKTPLHSAQSGRASQLAGEGHTGRGR